MGHIAKMRGRGHEVTQTPLGESAARGTFVPPTLIEVNKIADVEREVFGPVLHVLRYKREALDKLIDDVNAAGYGLTFGLHTRIDETIARVVERIEAGNIYVNRNIIGATVGVQPFGGSRLSGTGPKAGGPLYLSRLVAEPAPGALDGVEGGAATEAIRAYGDWLAKHGHGAEAERCVGMMARSPLGARAELKGPVGERNVYTLRRRGRVAAVAASESGLLVQIGAILATGNDAVVGAALAEARPFGIAGGPRSSDRACRGPIERARPRLRPSRRRRGGDVRGLAQARGASRADRAAPGAVAAPASPRARTTTLPTWSRNARPRPTPPRPAAMRA